MRASNSVAGLALLIATVADASPSHRETLRPPVIDMHLHAGRLELAAPVPICPGNFRDYPPVDAEGNEMGPPPCPRPILSATNSAQLRDQTIAEIRRFNVRRAVLAGHPEIVADWSAAAPGLFLPAAAPPEATAPEFERLRSLHQQNRAAIFAELGAQYFGLRADHSALAPFWAMAEELDVPVGLHLGEGISGPSKDARAARYRASLTSPFQLEEVLVRHPRLRLYVMHAASPLTDEMIAMLFEYPQLYVDISANVWNMPRAQFYDQLKRLVDAGFSKRILFGSDQTIWPKSIGLAIASIEQAPFLTPSQKRDILYNNAARFLRLTPAQIAADHR